MQSTNLEEIKSALWEQSQYPCTRVAQVMSVRKSKKGCLHALLRGWSGFRPVDGVTIERPRWCPTGACDLEDVN